MLRLISKRPGLGIEITSDTVRLAAVSGSNGQTDVLFSKESKLPAGIVTANYSSLNIHDPDGLMAAVRQCLDAISPMRARRAALSLPDGVFRVQVFEFDELPAKGVDRDRLIRWRFEKSAFDISEAVIRHQVQNRGDKGFSVLACAAKKAVIAQYEDALIRSGLEPWSVGFSSLHVLDFYLPYLSKTSPLFALAHVSESSCTTIIAERGARFYRYKEVKRGNSGETTTGLIREIGDSLHFYTHMDRLQQNGVGRLYLTGDNAALPTLAEGLRDMTSIDVEVLSPSVIVPSQNGAGPNMAAVLGAGYGL